MSQASYGFGGRAWLDRRRLAASEMVEIAPKQSLEWRAEETDLWTAVYSKTLLKSRILKRISEGLSVIAETARSRALPARQRAGVGLLRWKLSRNAR